MTMDMAIYISIGIVVIGSFIMVALASWLKKREVPEFSFLEHVRNFRINAVRYEKFASDARIMMYLYAFLAGAAWGKGSISVAITCVALFLGLQILLYWVKARSGLLTRSRIL